MKVQIKDHKADVSVTVGIQDDKARCISDGRDIG